MVSHNDRYSLRSDAYEIYQFFIREKSEYPLTIRSAIGRAQMIWGVRYCDKEIDDLERYIKHFIKYNDIM